MKIIVTASELLNTNYWCDFCEARGINEWCVNEGLMDSSETLELTEEEAVSYGLIKK